MAIPSTLADFLHSTLLDDAMPFWLRHGLDREPGGVFRVCGIVG
jgi:mannose/cellobiose epimerase-like protein (N-acyl-D-glucosamine 2-epimerase family)